MILSSQQLATIIGSSVLLLLCSFLVSEAAFSQSDEGLYLGKNPCYAYFVGSLYHFVVFVFTT